MEIAKRESRIEEKLARYFLNGKPASGFIYWINLLDALLKLIDMASDEVSAEIWGNRRYELEGFKDKLTSKGVKAVVSSGRDGNALWGDFEKYPIVACLVADPDSKIKDTYQSLSILIIQKIIISDSGERLNDFCTALRRNKNFTKKMYQIIQGLPKYEGDITNYKSELNNHIDNLLEKETDEDRSTFLRSIFNISSLSAHRSGGKQISDSTNISVMCEVSDLVSDVIDNDVNIDVIRSESKDGGIEYENHHYIKEEVIDNEDSKHRSLDRLVAETNKSRFWLRKMQQLSRFDSACLTRIEKKRLVRFIRNGLICNDKEMIAAALIVGIGYSLPIEVDKAIEICNTPDQICISMDGTYICRINEIRGKYKPDNCNNDVCENIVTEVKLRMQSDISNAIVKLNRKPGSTIFDRLNISRDRVLEVVGYELNKLRNNDHYGITKRRINYALKAELTLSERNSVLNYHILGSEKNAQPVLAYYGVLSVRNVNDVYSNSVKRMMEVA